LGEMGLGEMGWGKMGQNRENGVGLLGCSSWVGIVCPIYLYTKSKKP